MKKLRYLIVSLLTFILLLSSESVKAKNIETVDLEESGKVYGSIKFYGDSVGIVHQYTLTSISIKVCIPTICDLLEPQILDGNSYTDKNTEVKKEISDFYDTTSQSSVTYKIIVETSMYNSDYSTYPYLNVAEFSYVIDNSAGNDENDKDEDFEKSVDKVIYVVNTFIIPGLYIVLAVIIVIKGILLTIDLIKYSDNASVRKEKLNSFLYLGIVVFIACILNTIAAFITGLFG